MSVTFADIEAAAARIAGHAVETPMLESPALSDHAGRRVFLKPETLQRVGAFKFRGAYNRLVQLDAAQRKAGVVAFSSGNHAQGVALAARMLGMPSLIVMPTDAPAIKVAATRGYGADVVFFDRLTEDREAIAARCAAERGGAVIVPAFNDPHIIAGQGTIGLELARQAPEPLAAVAAPVGGGGLISGISVALKARSPRTAVFGVEPEAYDDARQSLAAGRRITVKPTVRSLCDALESPSTGDLTFPLIRDHVTAITAVSDAEVAEAMRYAFNTLKLVIEPGGSVALAALLAGKLPGEGPIALVLSGGNVDPDLFARVIRSEI